MENRKKEESSTHQEEWPELIDAPAYDDNAHTMCISKQDMLRFNRSLKQKDYVSKKEYENWTAHINGEKGCSSCRLQFFLLVDEPPTPDPTGAKLASSNIDAFEEEMVAHRYYSIGYTETQKVQDLIGIGCKIVTEL